VQRGTRCEPGNGKLDRRPVGKLQGLFGVSDGMQSVHQVAFVRLLRVKGSGRPHSEEGMIRMEWIDGERGVPFIRISDMEGMVHLIPLEKDKVWLVTNRLDFNT